jgi:predicted CoA-binding protein
MKKIIDRFVSDGKVALVGVGRKEGNWGRALMDELGKVGVDVFPVNPNTDEIAGRACARSISALPGEVKAAIISTKSDQAEQIAAECAEAGIERIWFQKGMGKGSGTKEAIALAREKGLDVVYGVCPMMFFGEPGFHGFHFKMRKFFGGLPKELAS